MGNSDSFTDDHEGRVLRLIEHYDGISWMPVPVNVGRLNAVSASSPASAWAVGSAPAGDPLALHMRCC